MNLKTQFWVAMVITFLAVLVATFAIALWMVLQIFAPKISDYAAAFEATPDLLLILAVFVGGTYVVRNLFD
jgi:ABC-type arginine transport system permease subunit